MPTKNTRGQVATYVSVSEETYRHVEHVKKIEGHATFSETVRRLLKIGLYEWARLDVDPSRYNSKLDEI